MNKVITYGTYDLLHQGHINLLRRAKELGDYLIVGVTSDSFDLERGKLNVRNNVLERVEAVRRTGYADEIIIEDYVGQKIDDIQRYDVDIFAIGSDWEGKFDYLNEFCKVVYLPRTEGISSTMLRSESQPVHRLGIIGTGRIAQRFVPESRFVSGVELTAVLNPRLEEARAFADRNGIAASHASFDSFVGDVDAVYISSPHLTHYGYAKRALCAGKHVLCEKPMAANARAARRMIEASRRNGVALMEAVKSTLSPSFGAVAENLHRIGTPRRYFASFCQYSSRYDKFKEGVILNAFRPELANGAMMDIGVYTLYPLVVLFGRPRSISAQGVVLSSGVDGQGAVNLQYDGMNATLLYSKIANSHLPAEIEGEEGNIMIDRIQTPVEVRFYPRQAPASGHERRAEAERLDREQPHDEYYYEIKEFIDTVRDGRIESRINSHDRSLATAEIIDEVRRQLGVRYPADEARDLR